MNLVREELSRATPARPAAVTIGKFDGVHRGHRYLLERVRDEARQRGLASIVVILHPNPLTVLRPGFPVYYLSGLEERIKLIRAIGVDTVTVLTFTAEVANLSARQFVALLTETLRMQRLVIGPSFTLGRGREGTPEILQKLGEELGFAVDICPPLVENGRVVSASAVRAALAEGDMETVAHLLGRPYALYGPVVRGVERGRSLGFPTANIAVGADRALPPFGVYITKAYLGEKWYAAATNIGQRPTFDDGERTVEVHILDFDGDLYEQNLRIELLKRVRGEMRFPSVEALKKQIAQDIETVRTVLT